MEPKKGNNEKAFLVKMLAITLTVIFALVGTLWAITWNSTEKKADKACQDIVDIKLFIAKQQEINLKIEKIEKKVDEIYTEVKK